MGNSIFRAANRAARRDIKAFRRAANYDTKGDYKATQSQIDSIYSNLRTSGGGLRSNLTATQQRELAAIDRIRNRNVRASAQVVRNSERGQVSRYGGALEGAVHRNLGRARATSSATRVSTLGQKRAGTILSNAGKLAMATQESAAAEAASSAEYATAVALKSRNQATAETVAQMNFELSKMKLDQKYAMASMEAEYDLRLRNDLALAEDARTALTEQNDAAFAGSIARINDVATNSFQPLQQLMNTKNPETEKYYTGAEAGKAHAESLGYEIGSDAYQVIVGVAANMYAAGAGPTNLGTNPLSPTGLYGQGTDPLARQDLVLNAVKETMMSYYPDQAAAIDEYFDVVRSKTDSQYLRSAILSANEATGTTLDNMSFWDRFKYRVGNMFNIGDIGKMSSEIEVTQDDIPSDITAITTLVLLGVGSGGIGGKAGSVVGGTVRGAKAVAAVEDIGGLSGLAQGITKILGKNLYRTGYKTIEAFIKAARAGGPKSTEYKTLQAMLEKALG